LYAAVEGKDIEGVLRRREIAKTIFLKNRKSSIKGNSNHYCGTFAQAAQLLLEGK
jgi:hypothetical protein